MIKADIHTHTFFSHADNSVLEMYMAARAKGLQIYGFSEHSPRPAGYVYKSDYQEKLQSRFAQYINEVQSLCQTNSENFKVLLGLEVDYIPAESGFGRQSALAAEFDYIIGGLHFQDKWGFDGEKADWDAMNEDERFAAYTRYYEDIASLCASGIADIIAHPDLIKMYTLESFNNWLKTDKAIQAIRHALEQIKKYDLIMEVSSAGLRKPCKEIYPGPQIMKIAAELKLNISISSDAHCTNQIGFAFDTLEEYVKSFGFTEYHYVEKRQKKAIKL